MDQTEMDGPYPSDGCSAGVSQFWKKITGSPPDWEYCCDEHDVAYWEGLTYSARKLADKHFYQCLRTHNRFRALVYYICLRTCGWLWFNILP